MQNTQQGELFPTSPDACAPCQDVATLTEEVRKLVQAFPEGDLLGHRLYHEAVIDALRARREFWRKMTFELVKWGLIGFIGWGAIQLWYGALRGPK